jgi:hypothetical protein
LIIFWADEDSPIVRDWAGQLRYNPETEFYSAPGWYYQIGTDLPIGPFDSKEDAIAEATR